MRDLKIIFTAAGSPSAPGLINCLHNNGERKIVVVGVDMKDDATIKQMVDLFYVVPSVNDERYIDKLLEICKKEKIDVLIPGTSQELCKLQERVVDFEALGTKVSVSRGKGLAIANDKIRLYEFMKENGFVLPTFEVARNIDEFKLACKKIGYPDKAICVKIKDGSGSRGVRLIDSSKSRFDIFVNEKPNSFYTTYEDMVAILNEAKVFPEIMIMEYLPGNEYSVDLLADNGKTLYICGRESNVVVASIPQEATLKYDEKAYEISRKIVQSLGLDGNVDLDFKFDKEGNPQLMEINPRLAATLSVIAAGGLNLLYLRVKQLLGEELPEVSVNYGVKLKRRYLELFCDSKGAVIKF